MVLAMPKACQVRVLVVLLQICFIGSRSWSCGTEEDLKTLAGESVVQHDDGECAIADPVSQDSEDDASSALALLQKSVTTLKKRSRSAEVELSEWSRARKSHHGISSMATNVRNTTMTTTSTTTSDLTTTATSTTIAGIQDTLLFTTTSPIDHHIWSYDMVSGRTQWLIRGIGEHNGGIAFDNDLGVLYIALPKAKTILRYVLAIRYDQIMMYDFQPVPICEECNAEWITVTDQSDVMYTDPVAHTINKIYKSTLVLISTGVLQYNQLETIDYVDFYKEYGPPSVALVNQSLNCYQKGYIFQVYTDMGHPSGIETYTGSTILWGNLVDGYKRGTVVQGKVEPIPHDGKIAAPVALTYAWDSIFNFYKRPGTSFEDASALFLALNGTVGLPPIPGDVHGALVAIPPTSANFPIAESIVMAWDFKKPRGLALYRGTDDTIMIGDETGITAMSSTLMVEDGSQFKLVNQSNVCGMLLIKKEDEAIPVMVNRDNGEVGQ
jgi:hypothetical protein